jgi:fumarate reductase subunit D
VQNSEPEPDVSWMQKDVTAKDLKWLPLGAGVLICLIVEPLRVLLWVILICVGLYYSFRLINRRLIPKLAGMIERSNTKWVPKHPSVGPKETAWIYVVVFSLFVVGHFMDRPTHQSQTSNGANAAQLYFATTVIECYGMNDLQLMLNASRCKDAARRVKGH